MTTQKLVTPKDVPVYQAHGVPFTVLNSKVNNPEDFCITLTKESEDSVKHIRPSEQKRMFEQTLKNPTKVPYIYLLSAKSSDLLPKLAAFKIFQAAFKHIESPYWHIIDGSMRDKLRDDESYRSYSVPNPNLLVITGLASNSLASKFDKCRDLLEMYSSIPRVIVSTGDDPLSFNEKCLFVSVNKVMFFA